MTINDTKNSIQNDNKKRKNLQRNKIYTKHYTILKIKSHSLLFILKNIFNWISS